jgi:hypothetical protein
MRAERQQLRAWALAGKARPDVQRAAESGYDVTTAVIDSIEAALPEYDVKDWGRRTAHPSACPLITHLGSAREAPP